MVRAKSVPRDETATVVESVRLIEDMRFFLLTAPANWLGNQIIRRYCLGNDEGYVSCVRRNGLFFITGTDIVRAIMYKFHHFGRTITDRKKFEEGVFLDLRNLRVGNDAVLENPKLEFLDFLHQNQCIRTQKKQKVFFWYNVSHDKLMADALERDIKRERAGQAAVSKASREPALSFNYDSRSDKSIEEQLNSHLSLARFKGTRVNNPDSASSVFSETQKYDSVGSRPSSPIVPNKGRRSREGSETEAPPRKKNRHEIDEEDFPLDYLEREVHFPPMGHENFSQDTFFPPGYGLSAGFFHQQGFSAPLQDSPVNIIRNEDYIIEQSPLPKFPAVPIQMLIPRLTTDNHPYTLLPPLSAHLNHYSSNATFFPLLASDLKPMFDGPTAPNSATQASNLYDAFYHNQSEVRNTSTDTKKTLEFNERLPPLKSANVDHSPVENLARPDIEVIPTPDSSKQASEI